VENGPAGKGKAYESMSRGRALGSGDFKRELLREHNLAALTRAWDAQGAKEVREGRWRELLDACIAALPVAARKDVRKCAAWKVAVATHMKAASDASNDWLARQLDMGSGTYPSKHVGLARRNPGRTAALSAKIARKVKGKA